jgi:hypothetical protein
MADDHLGDRRIVVDDEDMAARSAGGGSGTRGVRDVLHTVTPASRPRVGQSAVRRRVDVRLP